MTMVNCNKTTYLAAIGSAYNRGTKDERAKLRTPESGLFPKTLFRHTEDGRIIGLCGWLMLLRADMRGKLALRQLLKPEFEQDTLPSGQSYRKRLKPSQEAFQAALQEQHAITLKLLAACPGFFEGMIVDDVDLREETAVAAAE